VSCSVEALTPSHVLIAIMSAQSHAVISCVVNFTL
jgi:hypothetical protein